MVMKLALQWTTRLKLWAESDKLWAESAKLWAEGAKLRAESAKLWAEGAKLRAESDKLRAEGAKLRAESDKLWVEAIIKSYGNITLEWECRGSVLDCALENGDVYRGDEEIAAPQAPSGEGGE